MLPILMMSFLLATADGGAPPGRATAHSAPALLPTIGPATAAAGEAQSYDLRRADDGSGDLTYKAASFSARIKRDGTVEFHDRSIVELSFLPQFLPVPIPRGVPSLETVIRGRSTRQPPKALDVHGPAVPVMSRHRPDPAEACLYPRPCFFTAIVVLVGASGGFDVSDMVQRFEGKDPYRFDKARFLAGTSELRTRMAGHAHAEDLRHASADIDRRMESIASDGRLPIGERISILRAIRDEIDPALPEGRDARDRIARFVDARFGSLDAAANR